MFSAPIDFLFLHRGFPSSKLLPFKDGEPLKQVKATEHLKLNFSLRLIFNVIIKVPNKLSTFFDNNYRMCFQFDFTGVTIAYRTAAEQDTCKLEDS